MATLNCFTSMATLTKLPFFLPLSPHKLFLNQPKQGQLCLMTTHDFIPQKIFRIYACSAKKTRRNRKVKSNVELCDDIREFVLSVGFPEGYVPSLKDLQENGRIDLANLVRRRGYKIIREILANTPKVEVNGLNEEDKLDEEQSATSGVASLTGQEEKAAIYDSSQSSEASISTDHSACEVETMADDRSFVAPLYTVKENVESGKCVVEDHSTPIPSFVESNSLISPLLEEKVANFIQNGELDVIEDDAKGILYESRIEKAGGLGHAAVGTDASSTFYGSTVASEYVSSPVAVNQTTEGDQATAENQADHAKDVETGKVENQVEVNQLKSMLHQKELELSRLKDQVEKEKLSLVALQEKAEAEIKRAQKLISTKDAELYAAEETLSGLVEVKIQYSGDAETVEVAGAFNGWHHQIKMEPQPSASLADPLGSRKPRVWSTMLWLYPGTYEIKFIVDGQWKINPQMQEVTRGGISNNILIVDR